MSTQKTSRRIYITTTLLGLFATACQVTVTDVKAPTMGIKGEWDTVYEPSTAGDKVRTNLVFTQTGDYTFSGVYENGASLSGTLSSHKMTGTWTNGGKTGSFEFNFNDNWTTFMGSWHHSGDSKHYSWTGTHR
jgi:hypothetical protein